MLVIHDHESHGRPGKRPRIDIGVGQNMDVAVSAVKEEEDQLLREEIIGCDHLSLSSLTANCCVQSDSAFCMTSSTSRLSGPETCDLIVACKCMRGRERGSHGDQLGYLLEASDEELGIPTEIRDVGACETYGWFSDLQSLDAAHALNGGVENSVCIEEVGDFEVWEIGAAGKCDVYGFGLTSQSDEINCISRDLGHGRSVQTIE